MKYMLINKDTFDITKDVTKSAVYECSALHTMALYIYNNRWLSADFEDVLIWMFQWFHADDCEYKVIKLEN